MRFALHTLIPLAIHCSGAYSDFLGPRFPAPTHLAGNDSLVATGWKNLTAVFDTYFEGNRDATPKLLDGLENLTFSIGMFSIHDSAAQSLQYHFTSNEVKNGPGIDKVDGNSIYRVASISKLFTVFAGLLELDDNQWDRPITDFITGFSESTVDEDGNDIIGNIQWKEITLRALASQIAGVPRDSQPWIPDLSISPDPVTGSPIPDPAGLGLPPIGLNDPAAFAPCFEDPDLFLKDPLAACPPELYFEGALGRPPTFQAWTTPGYADTGFILFGIALANVTGKPIAQVYPDAIFDPLRMVNSKSAIPSQSEWSQYVIPGNDPTQWGTAGGISVSSGGLFSSLNDLAIFGTALMNSTLLPADKTREWMKPVSHTAQMSFSVGTPWEIYRYTHANTGAVTDIYTKLGDSGDYTGYVVLLPDYEAGFNIISSSTNVTQKSILAATIADLMTTTLIPVLEAQAAVEAKCNFAGTYESKDPYLNSSLTLTFNESSADPGLYITSWVSNGTDMMTLLPVLFGASDLKLLPSIKQPSQVAFRAVPVWPKFPPGSFVGPFLEMSVTNGDWLNVDLPTYGGVGLSLFVFDVGADGRATFASPAATRAKLERVG